MFDITRPCVDCPARKGNGEKYRMRRSRLESILEAPAFQCHKTVEYLESDDDDYASRPGDRPQQCAGMMAVMERSGRRNEIMQVAIRLDELDPADLDPRGESYDSIEDMMAAHGNVPISKESDRED